MYLYFPFYKKIPKKSLFSPERWERPLNTKTIHKHGVDLEEINKNLKSSQLEKRHRDWYHTIINRLNNIEYFCILTVVSYFFV